MSEPILPDYGGLTFEDFKVEDDSNTFWWASVVGPMLGYKDLKSFQKVLDRTTKAFIALGISHYENIKLVEREFGDATCVDYKLTRFACYLAAMSGDPKKEEVAFAQAYFAEKTRLYELHIQAGEDMDRMLIRDELMEGNKSLSAVAHKSGVEDYAKFMNAGYLGMYNMMSFELATKRNIKKEHLFDSMGRTELAANLFRVTQTEERIKSRNINGQFNLERTHENVGREVRDFVVGNTGKAPENLRQSRKLAEFKKGLKKEQREMKKVDKPKRKKLE